MLGVVCGTAGLWNATARSDQEARLAHAVESMRHRGPDDTGIDWVNIADSPAAIGLALDRLAIVDLSPAGHQPMTSVDGRYTISFNGEISNYVEIRDELTQLGRHFVSHSDTEVLLQAWAEWGEAALDKLEGMYAIALLDRERDQLTLARDVYGIKPLYYFHDVDSFGWCSEIQGILAMRRSRAVLNRQVALDYLNWGLYDADEHTFVTGVRQLQPGHVLRFNVRTGHADPPQRYWWPSVRTTSTDSFETAVDTVRSHFLRSVRANLRSDVPVAVALSGGIDSSAITSAVRTVEPTSEIHTFSYVADDPRISEAKWIDLVNERVGATGHRIHADGDALGADLDRLIRAQGEPFGTTSIYAQYRVFERVRNDGFVVTLDGQGADELFAGYHGYPSKRLHSLIEQGKFGRARAYLREWASWPGRDAGSAMREAAAQFAPHWLVQQVLGAGAAAPLLEGAPHRHLRTAFPAYEAPSHFGVRLKGHLRSELTQLKLPALLRHGDRNSMAFSVESRVPFLDRELTSYVLSLPEEYLVGHNGESKRLLRAALRGLVPDEILDRRDKIGFETPQSRWLDALAVSSDSIPEFLNPARARELLQGAQPWAAGGLRWRLINLVKWAELFDVALDAESGA